MQLSEATSSANPASLALLANVPVGQAAPSATSLFAEIFAAVSKTPEKSDATDATKVNTDPAAMLATPDQAAAIPPQTSLFNLKNVLSSMVLRGTNTPDTEPEASAPPAQGGVSQASTSILPGSADSQSTASRLFATLGLAPSAGKGLSVPVSQRANFAPVASDLAPQNGPAPSSSEPVSTQPAVPVQSAVAISVAPQPVVAPESTPAVPALKLQNVPTPPAADPVAPLPGSTDSSQQGTPSTPITPAAPEQTMPATEPLSKLSVKPPQPAKPAKRDAAPEKQPARSEQNFQIPFVPITLSSQTPESATKAATIQTSTPATVQPSYGKTADQSVSTVPSLHNGTSVSNSGNLSFAMRVGLDSQTAPDGKSQPAPEQPNTQSTAPAPQPSDFAAPATPVVPGHPQSDEKPAAEHAANTPESLIAVPTDAPVHTGTPEVRPAHSPEPAPAPAAEIEPKPSAPTTEPVRNMHIQLTGDDNQRVNVHLVDRGGELRLSVKSPDASLAQTLQEHMPELTTRLEQQRYRTEVWMPKESAPASSSNTNSNGSPNPGYGNSDGRQNGQQPNRPDWLEDLEDNPRRPQTTRRNQSWEQ